LNDNLNATVGDGRINMSTFLENMHPDKNNLIDTKAPVKTLFDHGHTQRNKMVIYDDDPRIEAVMKQALDRH
jgi:muramoyltetrapeptide carboxypeptidase LdcA involved in peptidoglycan recycling